jgi:hypothetical protein
LGKPLAGFGEFDSPTLSPGEGHPEEGFEFPYLFAEQAHAGRIASRREAETTGLGDEGEVSEAVERKTAPVKQGTKLNHIVKLLIIIAL